MRYGTAEILFRNIFCDNLVTGLPYIRPIPKITAVAGEVLKLKCPVSGYPIEQITWEKGKLSSLNCIRVCVRASVFRYLGEFSFFLVTGRWAVGWSDGY